MKYTHLQYLIYLIMYNQLNENCKTMCKREKSDYEV